MNEDRFIGPVLEGQYLYNTETGNYDGQQPWVCHTCGIRPTSKITSGTPECHQCWDWRKLDGPAANHWAKVAALFMSNVDMHDVTTYLPKRCGIDKDELAITFKVADQIATRSREMLVEHNNYLTDDKIQAKLVDLVGQLGTWYVPNKDKQEAL
jgi:hypothetical protein